MSIIWLLQNNSDTSRLACVFEEYFSNLKGYWINNNFCEEWALREESRGSSEDRGSNLHTESITILIHPKCHIKSTFDAKFSGAIHLP